MFGNNGEPLLGLACILTPLTTRCLNGDTCTFRGRALWELTGIADSWSLCVYHMIIGRRRVSDTGMGDNIASLFLSVTTITEIDRQ